MTSPLLVLGHAADRTGPPLYLLNFLRWLDREGIDVDVEVALLSGGPLLADMEALVPVTVLGRLEQPSDDERDLIIEGQIDADEWWARRREQGLQEMMAPFGDRGVVYVNGAPAIELARALPDGDRVLLSHVHELEIGLVHRLAPVDRCAFLDGATRVFSVAEAVTDHLVRDHGVDPQVVEEHRGMVDVASIVAAAGEMDAGQARRDRGVSAHSHLVVGCGTVEFRKGIDHFLQMAWNLDRLGIEVPIVCVWIGGDDEGIARAEARAESLRVDHLVHFVGPKADAVTWFAMADVFVLPSREDPFPLVCIESAAVGTPIVAFDTGGIPALLHQGCGDVVAYPDVEALAERVGALLQDPVRRGELGQRGRQVARDRHDVSVVAPGLWAAIERWL